MRTRPETSVLSPDAPPWATPANVAVVIPALNEEDSLPGVIGRLRKLGFNRIRVVDNGSDDNTAAVARRCEAEVASEPRRGYGQACWAGCENLPLGVQWILFCNADGSDDLERVPELLAATERGPEFVLGARTAGDDGRDHLTASQRFGNRLATALIRLLWNADYTDLGPLRLISRRAFERLNVQDRSFGWTVEMQVRAAEEKIRVREVAVCNFPRRGGASKISGAIKGSIQAGAIILSTITGLWLKRTGMRRVIAVFPRSSCRSERMLMMPFENLAIVGRVQRFLIGAGVLKRRLRTNRSSKTKSPDEIT